ncbi:MAG: IS630 family transposase [Candidatus Kuenenia stuttgartiensis]|nr:IS630 family transposase [Candidatus Kuenenia stuttgartiensis]
MPPSEYGIPKEFWDVPALREYTKAEFGVIYESAQSYHVLLKFSHLSFKYPDTLDMRRDERLVRETMAEIKKEINEYLSKDEWEVFVADETKIMLEAITRRAWLKKGEKTVLKVSRSRECQNYLGLLNQKSFQCYLYELAWQNQEEIIKALKKLLKIYPSKRICIVWDNAKFHKGKKITEGIEKGGALERIHFLNMPPYAPDMNPIEHVWKEAKQRISNIQFKDFEQTKKAFKKFIYPRKFRYAM